MESNLIAFIDDVYNSLSIYRALFIYPEGKNVQNIVESLSKKDYPIGILTEDNENMLSILKDKLRIYTVTDTFFHNVLTPDVNLIICLSKQSYNIVRDFIKRNDINEDNLYIFSFDIL